MTAALSDDEFERRLRQIGEERYHDKHPFHRKLHAGELRRGQLQAWVLNRYYYQSRIPLKDAALLSRVDDRQRDFIEHEDPFRRQQHPLLALLVEAQPDMGSQPREVALGDDERPAHRRSSGTKAPGGMKAGST